jgi:hypothetical protein
VGETELQSLQSTQRKVEAYLMELNELADVVTETVRSSRDKVGGYEQEARTLRADANWTNACLLKMGTAITMVEKSVGAKHGRLERLKLDAEQRIEALSAGAERAFLETQALVQAAELAAEEAQRAEIARWGVF